MATSDLSDVGCALNIIGWALTGISGSFLGARLYARLTRGHRRLWCDDYFIIASWIFLVVITSISTYAVELGFGRHKSAISAENLNRLFFLTPISSVFSLLAAAWSKSSFAITLLHLTNGWLRRVVWFIIITVNLLLTVNAILPFARCSPTRKLWDWSIPGSCWDQYAIVWYSIAAGAYSAAMDLVLALMPWKLILELNIKPKEKYGIAFCMSLGFLAGATSIMRCIQIPLIASSDPVYEGGKLAIWTAAEIAVTITVTSIPALRVLIVQRRLSSNRTAQSAQRGSNKPPKVIYRLSDHTTTKNQHYRSEVEGSFLKSISAADCTHHITTITSGRTGCGGGDIGLVRQASLSKNRHKDLTSVLDGGHWVSNTKGGIMKIETVAVDFDGFRNSGFSNPDANNMTIVGNRQSSDAGSFEELVNS
ncbi:hypothetical protein BX600DRAFT_430607 [Xylariales sp. PMI_506]|nr:hypothetical protein BX600DRAFT_430607 [Xylariales sp. PMI_506]